MTKADTKEVGFWITYWKPLAALAVLVIIVAAVWGSSQSKPVTPPSLKLAQKEGEVLFTENGAIWEFADVGTTLNYGATIKTGDKAKAMIQCPDGSFIRLSENTELKVNSVVATGILLTQNSGKTFHRLKNMGSNLYQINALGNTIKATGTAFDLSVNPVDQRINVKVFEGEVNVTLADGTTQTSVSKGREITVDAKSTVAPSPVDISADYANSDWFLWNKTEDLKLGYELRFGSSAETAAPTPSDNAAVGSTQPTGTSTKPTTPKTTSTAPKTSTVPATGTSSCKPSLSLKRGLGGVGIQLNWTTCKNDDFQFYKVVRSTTNSSPSYPSNPALVTSSNSFFGAYWDKNIAIGQTYYYRVCVVERLNKVGCGNVAKMSN